MGGPVHISVIVRQVMYELARKWEPKLTGKLMMSHLRAQIHERGILRRSLSRNSRRTGSGSATLGHNVLVRTRLSSKFDRAIRTPRLADMQYESHNQTTQSNDGCKSNQEIL